MRRALLLALLFVACSNYGASEAPSGEDAGENDGGNDASIAETSADGPSEGGGGGDAGCDATFCDDFDTTALGATWTSQNVDKTTVELTDAGRSAPFALKVTAPGGAFEGRTGQLQKRFSGVKSVICSFAVKPLERTGQPFVFYLKGTAPEVSSWETWIALTPSETRLGVGQTFKDGGASPYDADFAPVLPLNQWSVLEIATDLTKATLKIDGTSVASRIFPLPVSTSLVDVLLGILAFETTQQAALFDDLRCAVTN